MGIKVLLISLPMVLDDPEKKDHNPFCVPLIIQSSQQVSPYARVNQNVLL